ncbi:hypothetical protein WJX72_011920 [[Myrmecia] bisecta]|uniref:Uroporphyrinogen-III synthase n=1 Tax=[Myrmecia] bisecta TaxID=41462 RepID=A0AAW1P550_9CHLO
MLSSTLIWQQAGPAVCAIKQPASFRLSKGRHIKLHAQAQAHPQPPQVVLTREKGKNGKLRAALEQQGISCLELPLIETAVGPDRHLLPALLRDEQYDYITLTSPEAVSVFLEGWREAGQPQVCIAVVGEGTRQPLAAAGHSDLLRIEFVPSVANAVHLSAEIPKIEGGNMRVLYPSSAKAGSDLQSGLEARGFQVHRINTYNTLPVEHLDEATLQQARQAGVVAVASPSAVKAWLKHAGDKFAKDMAIACIGSTSARAAEKLGFSRVFYPEQPGMEGFVTSIVEALQGTAVPA